MSPPGDSLAKPIPHFPVTLKICRVLLLGGSPPWVARAPARPVSDADGRCVRLPCQGHLKSISLGDGRDSLSSTGPVSLRPVTEDAGFQAPGPPAMQPRVQVYLCSCPEQVLQLS